MLVGQRGKLAGESSRPVNVLGDHDPLSCLTENYFARYTRICSLLLVVELRPTEQGHENIATWTYLVFSQEMS